MCLWLVKSFRLKIEKSVKFSKDIIWGLIVIYIRMIYL